MAEMIYTNIEPKKEYSGFFRNQNTWKKTDGFKKLEADIRENGIKFPIVGFCNNGVLSETKCGNQRMAIALGLNINDIPAILFSIHHKTGFDGEQINELDDIIRICGEDIKNESAWDEIRGAWKKLPYPKNQ